MVSACYAPVKAILPQRLDRGGSPAYESAMAKSLTARARRHASAPALALVFALLLPFLLNFALTPALAAEQQLNAEIAASLCADPANHPSSDDHGLPADHHGQCCILCVSQSPILAPADATPIIAIELKRQQQPIAQASLQTILKDAPALEWASPRGPPATLPA